MPITDRAGAVPEATSNSHDSAGSPGSAADSGSGGLIDDLVNSFVYSAVKAPTTALSQIAAEIPGLKDTALADYRAEAPDTKSGGMAGTIAGDIGSALGMFVPVVISGKLSSSLLPDSLIGSESLGTFGASAARQDIVRSAATGLTYGALFQPSSGSGNFLGERLESGLAGAAVFGSLSAGSLGLRSLGEGPLSSGIVGSALRNPVFNQATAGVFAGAAAGQIDSLLRTGHLASAGDTLNSSLTYGLLGGLFGGADLIRRGINLRNEAALTGDRAPALAAPPDLIDSTDSTASTAGRSATAIPAPREASGGQLQDLPATDRALLRDPGPRGMEPADRLAELDKLHTFAESQLSTEERQRFLAMLDRFHQSAPGRGISAQQEAIFYKHMNRLVGDDSNARMSQPLRSALGMLVMEHAADPSTVDQGINKTCTAATLEHRIYAMRPLYLADMVADAAQLGEYTTVNGKTVDLKDSNAFTALDREAQVSVDKMQHIDGRRDFASSIVQTILMKLAWSNKMKLVDNGEIVSPTQIAHDSNGNVIGKLQSEPSLDRQDGVPIYDAGHLLGRVDQSDLQPLLDQEGDPVRRISPGMVAYDGEGNEVLRHLAPGQIEYDKVPVQNFRKTADNRTVLLPGTGERLLYNDGESDVKIQGADGNEVGLSTGDILYLHRLITGVEDPPFVLTFGDSSSKGQIGVHSEGELRDAIQTMQENGNLPGIANLDAKVLGGGNHGEASNIGHVVNVQGLTDNDASVVITNQYGRLFDSRPYDLSWFLTAMRARQA